jgi:hypothetical protein
MRSHPVIQSALTESEQQFTRFVERHASTYGALYETDGSPGDTLRVTVSLRSVADEICERHHTVEFMTLRDGHWEAVGRIDHAMRQIETMQGRHLLIESTFEIAGPGVPHGRFRRAEVETVVRAQLAKLRSARLLPLRPRRYAEALPGLRVIRPRPSGGSQPSAAGRIALEILPPVDTQLPI